MLLLHSKFQWRPATRSLDSHLKSMFLSSPFTLFSPSLRPSLTLTLPNLFFGSNFTSLRWYSSVWPLHPNTSSQWNKPISFSEVADEVESHLLPSIPVRAFFFSTSVDLKSLVDQNKPSFLPPCSRMANYLVLKFGNLKPEPNGLGASLSGSDCGYMMVFQYGSIVLFNVHDHEVDGCLKIVKKHASGFAA